MPSVSSLLGCVCLELLHAVVSASEALRRFKLYAQSALASAVAFLPVALGARLVQLLPQHTAQGKTPAPPTCVAIVLLDAISPDLHGLAKLVGWCGGVGLTTVFLYDAAGRLKETAPELQRELEGRCRGIGGSQVCLAVGYCNRGKSADADVSCTVTAALPDKSPLETASTGPLVDAQLHRESGGGTKQLIVCILSAEDSYAPLVEVAAADSADARDSRPWPQQLCSSSEKTVNEHKACIGPANGATISQGPGWRHQHSSLQLQAAASFLRPADVDVLINESVGPIARQEPNLVLVFGHAFSLGCFPPWVLRGSEIFHMGVFSTMTKQKLQSTLRAYCRTCQRFGT